MKPTGLLVLLCLAVAPSFAQQKKVWSFRDRPYYRPVTADVRAAQTSVLFPARSSGVPFAVNPGSRMAWDISVGKELPLFGRDSSSGVNLKDKVGPGKLGFGVYLPLSFHMVEDMSKDESNPVLNTDYRFGAMLKAQFGLKNSKLTGKEGNLGLRLIPWAHESTHIGDEFTLGALRTHASTFKRVNVSYEYWDLGGSFEPNYLSDGDLQVILRGGAFRLWNQQKGWFSAKLLQPYGQVILPSVRNYEPYFQGELYLSPCTHPCAWIRNRGWFFSADIRNRTVYNYARTPGQKDSTQWSSNFMAGIRPEQRVGIARPSYFLRYYHGVNPAGQFRSQVNYQLYGFGVLFEF